jgi:hypothetical protein
VALRRTIFLVALALVAVTAAAGSAAARMDHGTWCGRVSSPHWSCGWGYGFYHGKRNQMGRSGPICSHRGDEVEGTGPGFTQEPTARPNPGS